MIHPVEQRWCVWSDCVRDLRHSGQMPVSKSQTIVLTSIQLTLVVVSGIAIGVYQWTHKSELKQNFPTKVEEG